MSRRTHPALLAWLAAHGEVLSRQFTDERVIVHCRIPEAMLGRIDPAEAEVTPHGSTGQRSPADGVAFRPAVS
jgi:hypothetical protein